MAQELRPRSALAEGRISVPSTHTGWLTAASNPASRGFASGFLRHCTQVHIPTHAYTHIIKNNKEEFKKKK